jgi:hypothetical protein
VDWYRKCLALEHYQARALHLSQDLATQPQA